MAVPGLQTFWRDTVEGRFTDGTASLRCTRENGSSSRGRTTGTKTTTGNKIIGQTGIKSSAGKAIIRLGGERE